MPRRGHYEIGNLEAGRCLTIANFQSQLAGTGETHGDEFTSDRPLETLTQI
jgi:hypothetical protein